MSQLTQNTTDLDALIAKANALPDAGAGGGAAVETQRITINVIDRHSTRYPIVTYVNANGKFITYGIPDYVNYIDIDCAKNGFMLIWDISEVTEIIGSAEIIIDNSSQYLFEYWGDATIHIKG